MMRRGVKQSDTRNRKRSCDIFLRVVGMTITFALGTLSLIQSQQQELELIRSMTSLQELALYTSSSSTSSNNASSSAAAFAVSTSTYSIPPPPKQEEQNTNEVVMSAERTAAASAAFPWVDDKMNDSSDTITSNNMVGGLVAGPADGGGITNAPPPASRRRRRRRGKRQQKQVELPPPRPESLQENATVSACLLIRDDNDILPEWLAYHYHTIALRHLIVAIDPLSSESPSSIFQKWRNTTDLDVVEWEDAHYMPASFLKQHYPPSQYMQTIENLSPEALLEVSNHRYRQRVFLAKCLEAHREKGNSWVMHIDTDEYIVASKLLRQRNPDYVDVPNMTQPNSVLRLLQQATLKTAQEVSYPCISMPRVLFGSVESRMEDVNSNVPAGFNASSFETLRWLYHASAHNMSIHGNPKVILDVAAIPEQYFTHEVVYSIHRPIEDFCPRNQDADITNFRTQPIAVNHYLGSWERYAGRNDKRRSREKYDMKANLESSKDVGVQEWLTGFCNLVGHDAAAELLGPSYLTSSNAPSLSSLSIVSSSSNGSGKRNATYFPTR